LLNSANGIPPSNSSIIFAGEEIYFISNTKRSEQVPSVTTMIKNQAPVQVPAGAGKKTRTPRKKSPVKGFFGLLPDWKIDTQALKDELRD
jgi:hypothetical protein